MSEVTSPSQPGTAQRPQYCQQCGSALDPQARFCPGCGRSLARAGPQASDHPGPAVPDVPDRPRRRRRGPLLFALVAVVVLLAAAGYGAWQGVQRGEAAGPEWPTPAQAEAIATVGEPQSWLVTDGPPDPGVEPARFERWFYPEQGRYLTFFNGVATEDLTYTPEDAAFDVSTPVSPTRLDRSMSIEDVEGVLGESGEVLDPVPTSLGELDTRVYPTSRLVVSYLEGRFYAAQTV